MSPLIGAGDATAQDGPASVTVQVVDAVDGRALPNAEVRTADGTVARLTDERGEVRLPLAADRARRVRVRQVGYRPAEHVLSGAGGELARVALTRAAFALPPATVRGASACMASEEPEARAAAVPILGELRQAADHYESFRRSYPFNVRVVRRTLAPARGGQPPRLNVAELRTTSDEWAGRYRPGSVVEPRGNSFHAEILFVSTLADPKFWEHHCFAVRGLESLGGQRVMRVAFAPGGRSRGSDWSGAALLDSATGALLRVEFRLEGSPRWGPRRLEGYTTFRSASPFVMVPDSTFAVWWHDRPADGATWGDPSTVQLVRVAELTYRRRRPPALDTARPALVTRPSGPPNATSSRPEQPGEP